MAIPQVPHCEDLSRRVFRRILILKPSSLGDVVHAMPVLHGLRKRWPEAAIDWLVATSFAPLVEDHPDVNEAILFDRHRFGRMARSARVARDFFFFVRDLRARRYDLTIDLQGLFRTGFLSWTTGAPVRIGFRTAREGAWMFYTHRIRADDPDMHAVDKNYLVAKPLGFDDVPVHFTLKISKAAHDWVDQALAGAGVGRSAPASWPASAASRSDHIVAVVPGARWETKRWPVNRFAEVIDSVHSDMNATCVLIGGPDEVELCNTITSLCRSQPVDLSGKTTIPQMAALIERADVILCQDSAAAHLAVAFNSPMVCLSGPTYPRRTGPYRRLADVLRVDISCSPCYLRRLSQCRHDHRCMQELATTQVVAALAGRLAGRAKR